MQAHWSALVAADFFTTEVWTARGLVTYYTAFVLDVQSRRVQTGSTALATRGAGRSTLQPPSSRLNAIKTNHNRRRGASLVDRLMATGSGPTLRSRI